MNRLLAIVLLALSAVLAGCAHPITMNADLDAVPGQQQARIDKQVGYHISDASRALEVTTPGGGGDKVRYFPYRDLEPGLYKALSQVFSGVTKINNPADMAALKSSGIAVLITPEISTTSYSASPITWPPTQFGVNLVCTISDPSGKPLKTMKVAGEGAATFSEFKSNFSLAATRASNDALAKLVKALAEEPLLRN